MQQQTKNKKQNQKTIMSRSRAS